MTNTRRFPVSVILERRPAGSSPWATEEWEAIGVVAGERGHGVGVTRTPIRADQHREQFLWSGFALELYADEAESYYSNLRGGTPSVFVVCRQGEDDPEMIPFLVTVSYDEVAAHMEVEDPAFSVAMPPEVYLWLERYVVENYVPTQKKRRKRKKWAEQEEPGRS
jgi:hypothetical protein